MNKNIDFSPWVVLGKIVKELTRCIVLRYIEWIKSLNCWQLVFELEYTRHEAFLIAEKEICSCFISALGDIAKTSARLPRLGDCPRASSNKAFEVPR